MFVTLFMLQLVDNLLKLSPLLTFSNSAVTNIEVAIVESMVFFCTDSNISRLAFIHDRLRRANSMSRSVIM